jgi:hypothetical protein
MLYQHGSKSQLLCSYDRCKEKKLKEMSRLNEIILTEEMNQLHRNGILLMFNNICCDKTYVLKWLTVQNDLLHWLCTNKLILKQYVLLSI